MNKIERKINRTVQLAKNVRLHRADGGETDPMLDQDFAVAETPNYGRFSPVTQVPSTRDGQTYYIPGAEAQRFRPSAAPKEVDMIGAGSLTAMPREIQDPTKFARTNAPASEMLPSKQEMKDAALMAAAGFGSFVPETAHFLGMGKDVLSGKRPDFEAKTPYGYEEMVKKAQESGAISQEPGAIPQIIGAGSQFVTDPANLAAALKTAAGAKMAMSVIPKAATATEKAVELAKAPRSDLGFYSHGSETALNLPQAKGTAEQMVSMLRKAGVKPVELENAGLIDAAGNIHPDWQKYPVTREELAQHLQWNMPKVEETVLGRGTPIDKIVLEDHGRGNEYVAYDAQGRVMGAGPTEEAARHSARFAETEGENPTKFGQYTLPGGENYREVALTLPGNEIYRAPSVHSMGNDADVNRLAHIRMSDRTGPNGEKLLHVEEIQSDWGQKGRDDGFGRKYTPEEIQFIDPENITDERKRNEYWNFKTEYGGFSVPKSDRWSTAEDAKNHLLNTKVKAGVPEAPYVTSTQGWTDLALKRVMKEAAEGGYDGVVFTPGAEQAKRYDLSKQVSHISYDPNTNYIQALDHNGRPAINEKVPPEKLADYVGKDVAEKLLATEPNNLGVHSLEGQDLSVGGSGMKGYYDKIVPKRLQELMKGHDKDVKLGTNIISSGKYEVVLPNGKVVAEYPDKSSANAISKNFKGSAVRQNGIEALHMPMTDKMRQSILSGQKAFEDGGRVEKSIGGGFDDSPMVQSYNQPSIYMYENSPTQQLKRAGFALGGFPDFTSDIAPSYTLDNTLMPKNINLPANMSFSPVHVLSGPSSDLGGISSPSSFAPPAAPEFKPVDYSGLISGAAQQVPTAGQGVAGGSNVPLAQMDLYKGAPIAQADPNSPFAPPPPKQEEPAPVQEEPRAPVGTVEGHCCFDKDAPVLMADGSRKAISEIVVGDEVLNSKCGTNKVVGLKSTIVGKRKMVKFSDHDFYSTDDHLFLTDKGWKTWEPSRLVDGKYDNAEFLEGENRTEPLARGDKMIMIDSGGITEMPYAPAFMEFHDFDLDEKVYDLHLDGDHTYVVDGFIVHNCSNDSQGGAITMRRYKAEGGPIKISPAQREAGNYKKEHLNIHGIPLSVEVKKGQIREKTKDNGKVKWKMKMPSDYGYVRDTTDTDAMQTDAFIGPDHASKAIWVVDQYKKNGKKFDEHKSLIGFKNKSEAMKAYNDSFTGGKKKKDAKHVTEMNPEEFKHWLKHGNKKIPVSSDTLIQKALGVVSRKK